MDQKLPHVQFHYKPYNQEYICSQAKIFLRIFYEKLQFDLYTHNLKPHCRTVKQVKQDDQRNGTVCPQRAVTF